MDFIHLWRYDRVLSKILCSTIPIPVHDLKIKVTDFDFFFVKSLQCLWLIWIVFGMNGYKILKCFRKEKRVSGELPCPATGLIKVTSSNLRRQWSCIKDTFWFSVAFCSPIFSQLHHHDLVILTFQTRLKEFKETNPAKNQVWPREAEWPISDECFPGNYRW